MAYFHLPAGSLVGVWLANGILLVTHPDATLVVAEVIDAPVDIIVNHPAGLKEGLLHVEVGFGRSLQEDQAVFFCESFALFGAHLAPAVQICLVADQHHHNVWIAVLTDLFQPAGEVVEGFLTSNVVHEQGPCRTSVVGSCYAFERLLTGGVPYLELNVFFVYLDGPASEFDSNGEVVLLPKPLIRELQEQTGLADA